MRIDLNMLVGEEPPGDFVLCVTDYECGSHEGDGYALVLRPDWTVELLNLSHCSCYGPYDKLNNVSQSWPSVELLMVTVSDCCKRLEDAFLGNVEIAKELYKPQEIV